MNNEIQTLRRVHWVSVVFPKATFGEVFELVPGLRESMAGAKEGAGKNFYRVGAYGDGARVFSEGMQSNMGTLVQLAGEWCDRAFMDGEGSLVEFFSTLVSNGGHFTRVDLAHDFLGVSFDDLVGEIKRGSEGCVTSHLKEWNCSERGGSAGVADKGRYFSWGQRSSTSFLRIYEACFMHAELAPGTVRMELELKSERANAVGLLIAAGNIDEAFGVVRSVLEFRVPSNDSNRARWQVAEWWERAIGTAKTVLSTVVKRGEVTLARHLDWHRKQTLPSLFALRQRLGTEVFGLLIAEGRERAMRGRKYQEILGAT